jgi:hypothetical protein
LRGSLPVETMYMAWKACHDQALEVWHMAHPWPDESQFSRVLLRVQHRDCDACGEETRTKTYKRRPLHMLKGPVRLVTEVTTCETAGCSNRGGLLTAEQGIAVAPPVWVLAWDAFAHLGQARFARHMCVREIREELAESYDIQVSEDCIEDYIGRYQAILAARQRDPEHLRQHYESIDDVVLTIDGLQPEKGHETLYTVRELSGQRVWFAQTLLSSSHDEVEKLIVRAKEMAQCLDKPIRAWMSDKQEAFVKGIAKICPGTPHRYCQNHFLRDVAAPMLEADSHAKVQMRQKVRGLRSIEKDILARQPEPVTAPKEAGPREASKQLPEGDQVVMNYCAAVRGVLNKNQGGPLNPPGLQMAEGLREIRDSIQMNIDQQAGGTSERDLERLAGCIDRGLEQAKPDLEKIPVYVKDVRAIHDALDPKKGPSGKRQAKFREIKVKLRADADPIRKAMGAVMDSFEPGLFAGGSALDTLQDNLDLERWFRLPKSHERKIHGHQHAGVRIVQEGPGLALALDAHHSHRRPFTHEELGPYLGAMPTDEELQAVERRKIMRRATSRKNRFELLTDLEKRYRSAVARERPNQRRI